MEAAHSESRHTKYHTAADGISMAKSIAFNNDGSLCYVSDSYMQTIQLYTWDSMEKKLVKAPEPNAFKTSSGRVDNMKAIDGTDIVMGGAKVSWAGNAKFEAQRKK